MMSQARFVSFLILLTFSLISSFPISADGYDPDPVWPLCGYEPADAGESTCPEARWASAVDDVNDTFGPRLKGTEHDWHFGIDLHAEDQQPVFAVTCGWVEEIWLNGGTKNNQEVTLVHFRDYECPDEEPSEISDCTDEDGDGDCYYTIYDHLSEVDTTNLAVGDYVSKGQFLGRTGYNTNSTDYEDTDSEDFYEHLHFELRDPNGAGNYQAFSTTSHLQRDAVHPHRLLKLADWDDDADNIDVSIKADFSNLAAPGLRATVTIDVSSLDPDEFELDLNRVEARVFRSTTSSALVPIAQFHQSYRAAYGVFPTPEHDAATGARVGFDVYPPFLDMERWVRQYSYADSSAHSLAYFRFMSSTGLYSATFPMPGNGVFVSPFSIRRIDGATNPVYDKGLDPTAYTWGYHLHVASGSNPASSLFNGMRIESANFNRFSSKYQLEITMDTLLGSASANALCIKVRAEDIYGNTTPWETAGSCGGGSPFP